MIKWIALGGIAVLVLLFIFLPVVAWILVGLVLAVLAAVLFVPVGADVSYIDGKFGLAARVDGFALQLLPKKERDPNKKPKEKAEKKKPEEPGTEKKPAAEKKSRLNLQLTKEELLELAVRSIRGLGKFGKIRVRRFMLHYTAAGDDPYNTAMIYGYVNSALCTLAPLCAKAFRVTGKTDVRTDVDFMAEKMSVDVLLSVTICLAQALRAGLAIGIAAVGVLLRSRKRRKMERAAAASAAAENTQEQPMYGSGGETETDCAAEAPETAGENVSTASDQESAVERNESNGE